MSRVAKSKNGHEPKNCERCGLPFEWRKKWERDWASVKYCSEKCKSGKAAANTPGKASGGGAAKR